MLDLEIQQLAVKAGLFLTAVIGIWLIFKGLKFLFKIIGVVIVVLVVIWAFPSVKEMFLGLIH